jgi:hypothetical protein
MPSSAGSSLGSCNWIIQFENEKFVYFSDASVSSGLHTWHPQPIDLRPLHDASALLLSNLSTHPHVAIDHVVPQMCGYVGVTVSSGGSVVIPCQPTGMNVILNVLRILIFYFSSFLFFFSFLLFFSSFLLFFSSFLLLLLFFFSSFLLFFFSSFLLLFFSSFLIFFFSSFLLFFFSSFLLFFFSSFLLIQYVNEKFIVKSY